MDSDTSSFIDTTYSVDEGIANDIEESKKERERNEEILQLKRRALFDECRNQWGDIPQFSLPGMHFYSFTHLKIKFGFNPSEVAYVSKRIKFICILKYTGRFWTLGRNTIPANSKETIYEIFLKGVTITDKKILAAIDQIHSIFIEWSEEHERFRKRKFRKYEKGELEFFDLDSEDEELYLSQDQRDELRHKRERILNRMIPPKQKKLKKKVTSTCKEDMFEFSKPPSLHLDSDSR